MASKSLTIMIIFNSSCFFLGIILYIIPITRMEDPTSMTGVQLCAGKLFFLFLNILHLNLLNFYLDIFRIHKFQNSTWECQYKETIHLAFRVSLSDDMLDIWKLVQGSDF